MLSGIIFIFLFILSDVQLFGINGALKYIIKVITYIKVNNFNNGICFPRSSRGNKKIIHWLNIEENIPESSIKNPS